MRDSARASSPTQPTPRVHGGLPHAELRALGLGAGEVLDLSASCNPYGPCARVVEAIRAAPIDRYPDPAATAAREALAGALGVAPGQIALGNGAAELLWTLASLLVRPGAGVVVVEPAFCELRIAAEHAGGQIHDWRARPDDGFAIDLSAVGRVVRDRAAAIAYLCAPGTPTGAAVPAAQVRALAEAHPATTFVLDQSFLSLSERFADATVAQPPNVACIRSLTKDFAIPGVRVGYVVAAPALIARIERARAAWTTSAAAQAAAIAPRAAPASSSPRAGHACSAIAPRSPPASPRSDCRPRRRAPAISSRGSATPARCAGACSPSTPSWSATARRSACPT
ncbi:MAG TPA: aminotransferase class I/II-fold pyridoxal phosphate-dependent enzyme, partial [Kofleriaceae bacterium]|nr:aminotransferase class I/II-fold pyridoxal phosphate-dependent enzyme [Kofleriaceae bacterium]